VEPGVTRRAAQANNSPEARTAALQKILARRVRNQLLYKEAIAVGIPERPQVQASLRAIEDKTLAEDWLTHHVARGVQASAAQVEQEVQRLAGQGQANGQELRRFSHIFLRAPDSDAQARSKAWTRMAEIRRELADGAAFEEMATKYSDSITARGGGRVEWTPRAPLQDAVAEAVFSLSEGQVGEPVETPMGLHLFRLDGIRKPVTPDLTMVREDVKRRFDAEAIEAARAAERDRAFDASGARVDAQALARPGTTGDTVVASVGGWTLRNQELQWLREGFVGPQAQYPPLDFARWLVVNHVLAERRRAEPIEADLQQQLDDARFNGIVDVRKRDLVAAIPKEVSAAEMAEFYEKYRDKAPILRDHVIDLLFIPQTGTDAAEVYAKGEAISKKLRDGQRFDKILEDEARKPGTLVRRRLSAGDVPSLRAQSLRLGGTIGRLPVGEVSVPVYMEGEPVRFTGKTPLISAKGLVFARLVEIRSQPLESVRPRLREAIQHRRQSEGVAAIFKRLDDQAALKIVVANP
jgi:hypothetical protein